MAKTIADQFVAGVRRICGIVGDSLNGLTDLARRWWPAETADAMRLGVTSLVAIYLAMYFELDDPHWAGWTVFSVSLATRASFFQKSTFRAFSTLLGAVVSIVLMDDLAQSTLGYDVALALWLGLMTYFASLEQGLGSYGFALMGFIVPILTLGNVEAPLNTFDTAVSRCSEPILGVGCAYVSSVLVAHETQVIRRDSANAIEATAQDCAAWDAACHEVSHRGGGVCFRGVPQRDGLGHHDGDFIALTS
jgi:uncharacterized membrane protein YccC